MASPGSLATINWVIGVWEDAVIGVRSVQNKGPDAITASLTSAPLFTYNIGHVERRPERRLVIKQRMDTIIVLTVNPWLWILSEADSVERLEAGRTDGGDSG
jgi:hypothetical protein